MKLLVRHDMQVAHRLLNLPGKCQNIHGHSMEVLLYLNATASPEGYAQASSNKNVLDFGAVKKLFRTHLDEHYDHRLLLNKNDPWARALAAYDDVDFQQHTMEGFQTLPGLVALPGDPSVENLAKWICEWASYAFQTPCRVVIHETGTNGVEVEHP